MRNGGITMKWGIMATGSIAQKFASTVNRMTDEGEILGSGFQNKGICGKFCKTAPDSGGI